MSVSRTAPANLRDISLHTAALRTLQLSVGRPSKSAASGVASVLGSYSFSIRFDRADDPCRSRIGSDTST